MEEQKSKLNFEDIKKDKEELKAAFEKFCTKYGENIVCFQIYKWKNSIYVLHDIHIDVSSFH